MPLPAMAPLLRLRSAELRRAQPPVGDCDQSDRHVGQ